MGRTSATNQKRSSVGSEIIAALLNAGDYAKGDKSKGCAHRILVPVRINVKRVRRKLRMSQNDFAQQFGISAATLRNWEQGRRQPEGPARVLLTIIDREPAAVRRVLLPR